MRTFLSISLSWLIRDRSGLRSQITHKHGIRKIFRHSTIIGLSSSLTIVGRGCYTRSEYRAPLFIAHLQLMNQQEIDPFPDWSGLKRLQEILHEQGGRSHARLSFSWLSASAHITTRRPLQLFRLVAVLFELHRHACHARPRTSVLLQQTIADAPAKFAISLWFTDYRGVRYTDGNSRAWR